MANLLCLLIFSLSDIFATFNKKYGIYCICFKDAAVIRDIYAPFIIINYYKERGGMLMNKFKKIGITALAGTLASLSAAQAGSMAVTGSAALTYVQRDSGEITGNPIGMSKDLTFKGSGELDNGWTVSVMHDLTDAAAWASSSITIGMGSLGTIVVDQGTGADYGSALDTLYRQLLKKLMLVWLQVWF